MSTSYFTVPFYAGVAYAMALGLRLPVCLSQVRVVLKGKVFPYSLPSVGPGADPGVQAVSPQVT